MHMLSRPREWYAFRVRPRHEKAVSNSLRGKCCKEFLPLVKTRSRWVDRVKNVDRPLFPGYIFCEAERHEISMIRSTPGILDVVRAGSSPLPARRDEVESLLRAVQNDLPMEACQFEDFSGGRPVRIATGALKGLCGVIAEVRGERRLVISIELLQRQVLVEIPRAYAELCLDNSFRDDMSQSKYVWHEGMSLEKTG